MHFSRRRVIIRLFDGLRLAAVLLLVVLTGNFSPPDLAHAATFTVNSAADEVDIHPGDGICMAQSGCTLRAAIQEANALAGDDAITIPVGTYTLSIAGQDEDAAATGDLDILGSLTINGAGAATTIIDGGQLDRIFHLPSGTSFVVNISGLTLRNGSARLPNIDGGAISSWGTELTITDCILTGNTAGMGGGISQSRGVLTVVDSVISGNTANDGSAYGGGIFSYQALVNIVRSEILGNVAYSGGGGVACDGQTTIIDSTISGNSAHRQTVGDVEASGGGVGIGSGSRVLNSTITGNSADFAAGIIAGGDDIELVQTFVKRGDSASWQKKPRRR